MVSKLKHNLKQDRINSRNLIVHIWKNQKNYIFSLLVTAYHVQKKGIKDLQDIFPKQDISISLQEKHSLEKISRRYMIWLILGI